jgi:hypothetical protein
MILFVLMCGKRYGDAYVVKHPLYNISYVVTNTAHSVTYFVAFRFVKVVRVPPGISAGIWSGLGSAITRQTYKQSKVDDEMEYECNHYLLLSYIYSYEL